MTLAALFLMPDLGDPASDSGSKGKPLQSSTATGLGLVSQPGANFRMPVGILDSLLAEGTVADPSPPTSPSPHIFEPPPEVRPTLAIARSATARAASQGGQLTEAEMRAILTEAEAPVGWHDALIAIAFCESRFSPYALGDGGNSIGLFQLWHGWARPMGYVLEDLYDPVKAARTAVYVRETRGRFGGPGGWTCADKLGIP